MNKIIYALLTIITFSCLSINANAANMIGVTSCGNWVDERTNNIRYAKIWFAGYMSGMVSGSTKNVLEYLDAQSIYLWTDNYCNTNPLNNLSEAGNALFKELSKKKGLK